jgi:hypothetical protein
VQYVCQRNGIPVPVPARFLPRKIILSRATGLRSGRSFPTKRRGPHECLRRGNCLTAAAEPDSVHKARLPGCSGLSYSFCLHRSCGASTFGQNRHRCRSGSQW